MDFAAVLLGTPSPSSAFLIRATIQLDTASRCSSTLPHDGTRLWRSQGPSWGLVPSRCRAGARRSQVASWGLAPSRCRAGARRSQVASWGLAPSPQSSLLSPQHSVLSAPVMRRAERIHSAITSTGGAAIAPYRNRIRLWIDGACERARSAGVRMPRVRSLAA